MASHEVENGYGSESHEMGKVGSGNGSYTDAPNGKPRQSRFASFHHKKDQRLPRGIKEAGESNRRGFHPLKFIKICGRSSSRMSMAVNILWPFVPAAIACYYKLDLVEQAPIIFALNFLAMIPTANLIGFAGQELARKLPIVFGVILECFLGSIVELVLLLILLLRPAETQAESESHYKVIKDAILGSILANMLLCLGTCFFVGGMREDTQEFDKSITEAGSGLLLVAGFALAIPCAFAFALGVTTNEFGLATDLGRESLILHISRATAIILLIAFVLYVFYQMRSHHNIFAAVLERDEHQDKDKHHDHSKDKLTLTECIVALLIAFTFVCLHAFFLVVSIDGLVETTAVSEMFLGLILIPLVEKISEHLTAIDEAWDNTPNLALSHILGSTIQTALLNAPIVVIIAWGRGLSLDLNFSPFHVILLILAILVVGQFLRDRESNYLEGALCVFVYVIIAVAAFYYPNHDGGQGESGTGGESATGTETGAEPSSSAETTVSHAVLLARAMVNGVAGSQLI